MIDLSLVYPMARSPFKTVTLEEFLRQPETEPASEYIDGKIFQKPMPRGKHSILQGELVSRVNLVLKPRGIARAFPELRCTFGGRSIVPDVAIFEWENIPTDENGEVVDVFSIAPDWSIEILSPEQSQTRVTKNILHCLQYGTRMGWSIDPLEKTVFVYRPRQETEVFDDLDVSIPVPDFAEDFRLTVGELFAWLKK